MPGVEHVGMSIASRQPGADSDSTTRPVSSQRTGAGRRIDSVHKPLGSLLFPSGLLAPAPVPTPARALALDALRLLRRMRDPITRPERWDHPRYADEVDLIRTHLAPLRTRKALAASFGREAFQIDVSSSDRDDPAAVRVAYALRWLELGDARPRSRFAELLHGHVD